MNDTTLKIIDNWEILQRDSLKKDRSEMIEAGTEIELLRIKAQMLVDDMPEEFRYLYVIEGVKKPKMRASLKNFLIRMTIIGGFILAALTLMLLAYTFGFHPGVIGGILISSIFIGMAFTFAVNELKLEGEH